MLVNIIETTIKIKQITVFYDICEVQSLILCIVFKLCEIFIKAGEKIQGVTL